MIATLGLVLVAAGGLLGLIGTLGAIGAGLELSVLSGRELTPLAKLAGVRGRAAVAGRAAPGPGGTYTAPLSGAPCVWYLTSESTVRGDQRETADTFPPQPFALTAGGRSVLVGPRCPALEQIAPSVRETRAADDETTVEVFEFVVSEGTELVASGDVVPGAGGAPAIDGDVVLSAAPEASAGDPVRARLRRNLVTAFSGWALAFLGAVIL